MAAADGLESGVKFILGDSVGLLVDAIKNCVDMVNTDRIFRDEVGDTLWGLCEIVHCLHEESHSFVLGVCTSCGSLVGGFGVDAVGLELDSGGSDEHEGLNGLEHGDAFVCFGFVYYYKDQNLIKICI